MNPTNPNLDPSRLESYRNPSLQSSIDRLSIEDPASSGEISDSPWAQMFPRGATKEQLAMFISLFVKDLIMQMKREDAHFKQEMERERRMREGSE